MFLKQFPDDVKLGAMIEIAFTLLQSILIRAHEITESRKQTICDDDLHAMTSLVKLLGTAKRDAEKIRKRMVN